MPNTLSDPSPYGIWGCALLSTANSKAGSIGSSGVWMVSKWMDSPLNESASGGGVGAAAESFFDFSGFHLLNIVRKDISVERGVFKNRLWIWGCGNRGTKKTRDICQGLRLGRNRA
ncbi:hypothetical protein OGAPHI_001527 [Ogataea philodendri]|uniref:Uncharacterized protein n=1 Tax=Ogataea philodendri TaxID=1378263 RepID=A0A9P8T812_9ASCO|nr:uncharacterized protein OGAPHI_001527 [Ogataea philodendri]KAH3669406.1 hypothetical protein OGAPHI_001527 [Ogataea philodendri]